MCDCSICFERIPRSYPTLKCGHKFHPLCIRRWNNDCPLCRAKQDIVPTTRIMDNHENIYKIFYVKIARLQEAVIIFHKSLAYTLMPPYCRVMSIRRAYICTTVFCEFIWSNRILFRRNSEFVSSFKRQIRETQTMLRTEGGGKKNEELGRSLRSVFTTPELSYMRSYGELLVKHIRSMDKKICYILNRI